MSSSPAAGLTDSSARPSLLRLTRVEGRKMIDTRAGLWLLIVTALLGVGGTLGESLGSSGGPQAADVFSTAALSISFLLPIVGILLVTSEWSQRTGLITFVLVPIRGRVVAAKLAAAVIIAIAAAMISLALGLLGGSALGGGTEIEAAHVGRGFLFLVIAVSIGVALGLAFMNSPLAIVLYFVGPLLFAAIGAISGKIGDVTVWLDQSVLVTLAEDNQGDFGDWDKVGVTALVWIALPLLVGMLRLRRGDID